MLSVEEVSTNCRSRGDGPTRLPPPLASPPPPPPPPPAPPPRPVVRTTMDAQPDWQHGQTMDLLTRTSWVDASVAYRQIRKVRPSAVRSFSRTRSDTRRSDSIKHGWLQADQIRKLYKCIHSFVRHTHCLVVRNHTQLGSTDATMP